MPRKTEPVATEHKGSIRVYWEGQEYYCGPWNDPASWRKFEALKEDLLRGPGGAPMTLAEMALAYWKHGKVWYRLPDKTPTSEAGHVHRIIKRLLKAHANTVVDDFGPRELRLPREADRRWTHAQNDQPGCGTHRPHVQVGGRRADHQARALAPPRDRPWPAARPH